MPVNQFKNRLEKENFEYSGSGGVSQGNSNRNFLPAFKDTETGLTVLSSYLDGRSAPYHILDGVPVSWITQKDTQGRVVAIKDTVVSGFLRSNKFYTRQEAADYVAEND